MKIDLDWIQKELDAGREVKLECVNVERFEECNHANHDILKQGKLRVKGVDCIFGTVYLQGDGLRESDNCILKREFEFFRIKRPDPTFYDLIDVAVQAYKDGVLSEVDLGDNGVYLTGLGFISSIGGSSMFQDAINDIKSLYTETFVIEIVDDLRRIKVGANGVLSNGSTFKVESVSTLELDWVGVRFSGSVALGQEVLGIGVLKGATVTQNMTRKEIL